jgi:hypothetical protein
MPSSVVTWHPDAVPRGTAGRLNGTFSAFSALGTVFIFFYNNILFCKIEKNSKAPERKIEKNSKAPGSN